MSVMKSGLYSLEHETPPKCNLLYNFETFKPGFCLGLKNRSLKYTILSEIKVIFVLFCILKCSFIIS